MTTMTRLAYTTLLRSNPDLRGPALPKPKRGDGTAPSEHEEQCAVMEWAERNKGRWPELELLHHIPNGGKRDEATAELLKAAGVKSGVPDLSLPVARRQEGKVLHGLYIELKKSDHSNPPSPEQRTWLGALRQQGYLAKVCYGSDEAIALLTWYLELEQP